MVIQTRKEFREILVPYEDNFNFNKERYSYCSNVSDLVHWFYRLSCSDKPFNYSAFRDETEAMNISKKSFFSKPSFMMSRSEKALRKLRLSNQKEENIKFIDRLDEDSKYICDLYSCSFGKSALAIECHSASKVQPFCEEVMFNFYGQHTSINDTLSRFQKMEVFGDYNLFKSKNYFRGYPTPEKLQEQSAQCLISILSR